MDNIFGSEDDIHCKQSKSKKYSISGMKKTTEDFTE